MPGPARTNVRVHYGEPEPYNEREEQFVTMPGVFLFAPRRDLTVQARSQCDWRRRRYETWDQDGQQMGRWDWEPLTARSEGADARS